MSDINIRGLLESRLATWAATQSLQIAFENQAFTPPNGMYLKAYMLPATTKVISLKGDLHVWKGLFQVTVVEPQQVGAGSTGQIAKALQALFPVNLVLTDSVVKVQVMTPLSVLVPVPSAGQYHLPTRFEYRADML